MVEVSVVLFMSRRKAIKLWSGFERCSGVFFGQVDSLAPRQQVQTLKCHLKENEGIGGLKEMIHQWRSLCAIKTVPL